ncbi:MAG TPA: methyltransferase domain-containing protein [Pseudonocardiaceae bacterium]|nr:methyltransferase domain-containing protein [Pseudonocardiaceae bacterium]
MTYVFAPEWNRERKRLAGIEAAADLVSSDVLSRLGVGPGWRCAEVGAGGGSLARWLADRVGDTGQVIATDLDIGYLKADEAPNLQVLQHDLTVDDRPGEPFDLVHTRLVLEHLPDPAGAAQRLAGWVRPGGWLVVEAGDWSTRYEITPSAVFEAALIAVQKFLTSAGFDPMFGRHLPVLLRAHGLVDVGCEARGRMLRGDTPEMEFFTLTIERARTVMVAAGLISDTDVAAALALCADPTFAVMSPALVSAWARVPLPDPHPHSEPNRGSKGSAECHSEPTP